MSWIVPFPINHPRSIPDQPALVLPGAFRNLNVSVAVLTVPRPLRKVETRAWVDKMFNVLDTNKNGRIALKWGDQIRL